MSRRRFEELDHPRWPRGTPVAPSGEGPGGGRFREAGGGGWAAAIMESIAGGGSIATGRATRCPICGRQVKVVGNGRLSTHNSGKGQPRCAGSGAAVNEAGRVDMGTLGPLRVPKQRGPSGGRRKATATTGPPRPPNVQYGAPLEPVTGAARARLEGWKASTRAPQSRQAQAVALTRQIAQARDEVARRERLQEQAKQRAHRMASLQGLSPFSIAYNEYVQDDQGLRDAMKETREAKDSLQDLLGQRRPDAAFDPTDPLASYGPMLHIEGDSWFIYGSLDALEQRVPAVFHRAAADFLASRGGGIWIGDRGSVADLDALGFLRKEKVKSKSWTKGTTFADVDGVVTGDGTKMAVVYSNNTERTRAGIERRRRDNQLTSGRVEPSAALHEFGHVLDRAIGYRERYGEKLASQQRLFRLIYSQVRREGGDRLNPHYRQTGVAGPKELWADALDLWASVDPVPAIGWGVPRGGTRQVTEQDLMLAAKYYISTVTAQKLADYYARMQRDLEKGKRIPLIDQGVPA